MGKSCKVVVCGQASVGKTAILEQLLYGNHVVGSEMIETQEDIYVGSIETDRGVREQVTIVVLGNKCDLQEQRRVDHDAAQHWAKGEKVKLWEVSVADRHTLIEPFIYLASKMTQPQSKSAFPLSRKNKGSGSMDG
ncbi:PREDICTED: NF-kappa-B inhibitor-interacting Ras-like protein 2 isoform X2 [Nipponia nippon]|uniref:NF-kappa-B inhibitor-interacting Ras-like protein 2 isoform X2 n=1 Tax=Nipponia nippon TaxID=128390 RepID=UPI0005117D2A|nr:PREDICTED: NF-kappa-B inhibitor-interacting Ras-like protein 2 isoform X2 [Nipponia nippon]